VTLRTKKSEAMERGKDETREEIMKKMKELLLEVGRTGVCHKMPSFPLSCTGTSHPHENTSET
jgi:hypothetical protein